MPLGHEGAKRSENWHEDGPHGLHVSLPWKLIYYLNENRICNDARPVWVA